MPGDRPVASTCTTAAGTPGPLLNVAVSQVAPSVETLVRSNKYAAWSGGGGCPDWAVNWSVWGWGPTTGKSRVVTGITNGLTSRAGSVAWIVMLPVSVVSPSSAGSTVARTVAGEVWESVVTVSHLRPDFVAEVTPMARGSALLVMNIPLVLGCPPFVSISSAVALENRTGWA